MKICVINFSGNVGKTTVAANLLQPRLKAPVFSVESLNQDAEGDGVDVQRLRAQRYGELQNEVLLRDAAIVDVGSSNVEIFLNMMAQYQGSHEDYDFFIVPTVKEKKQTADTVNTISALRALGVEPKRIKVIFNKVEPDEVLSEQFAPLFGLSETGAFEVDEGAVLYTNEVFELIKDTQTPLADVIADPTDHRQALREAKSIEAKNAAIAKLAIKRLSGSCARNLDSAYEALFAQ